MVSEEGSGGMVGRVRDGSRIYVHRDFVHYHLGLYIILNFLLVNQASLIKMSILCLVFSFLKDLAHQEAQIQSL